MSLTEEVDKGSENSAKVDAGCTPKLSRRRSVANDCGKRVVEILTKRTPGLSHRSSSTSSWLHAVKKSSGTSKHAVENRKKLCSLQLPFDTEPFTRFIKYTGCRPSADSMDVVINSSQDEANRLNCENKTSSSAHVKLFSYTMYCRFLMYV